MNRVLSLAVLALLVTGCATTGQIKEATDPLNQRLTAVEKQNADMQAKLGDINSKLDKQASDLAALRNQVVDSSAKAQQAAADAQAAATRAETAADKAAKAFELKQRKGAK